MLLSLSLLALWPTLSLAAYQACPLIQAYYPPPTLDKSSDALKNITEKITATFDSIIRTGKHDVFGEISPNTTSFSVVMFSGAKDGSDPVFLSYHYTAPGAKNSSKVTRDTVFPIGTLTQLFTVYAWLAKFGDQAWDDPITKYLPELKSVPAPAGEPAVAWGEVTIGALGSHMAGIARSSNTCVLGKACDKQNFIKSFGSTPALFLPNTTPVLSNAAFQLIAFALTSTSKKTFSATIEETLLHPLKMTQTSTLSTKPAPIFGAGLKLTAPGEPASLSLLSSTSNLALLGASILSSVLLPAAVTRRWLHPVAATSNLRNGVGRPWEIYHAGGAAIAPVVDIFLKAGEVGSYSSYFGLSPDVGGGFAILAYDESGRAADLNLHADVIADGLGDLLALAAKEAVGRYAGTYGAGGDVVEFRAAKDGPGFAVARLVVGGKDVRAEMAGAAGFKVEDLDLKVYPAMKYQGKEKGETHQFVAVVQDTSALVDAGTPTCITWSTVGASLGPGGVDRVLFELDGSGIAASVRIPARGVILARAEYTTVVD
ncbi:beta-lactamase/transpeptidase-like protein [Lasiosphaeris hirsuta]|uniref:Beta-lactamase/transpeptidase-like protein n=1 Tax=Lasiosphaeris hirsuta TaxID=260670 RepID=A0AA40DWD9_9PEZI|nr:beta-lactamase/transpeptidase-like protein [Lasiosphaeris hirsuta]